jgi:ribosomal protein S27AE
MRALRLIVVMLSLLAVVVAPAGMRLDPPKTPALKLGPNHIYACPKCDMASTKAGKCPGCKADLIEIQGTFVYTCAKDKTTASKAGNCPKCGKFMSKAVQTYVCAKCESSSTKAGKCPKCGKFMAKKVLPMMKPS